MTRIIAAAVFATVIAGPVPGAQAQGANAYRARLSAVPVAAVDAGSVSGSGSVTATLTGGTLTISGRFEGLESPATVARVHRGAKKGIRGPVLFELQVSSAVAGTVSGAFELTAPQAEDLNRERFYVQLHSEAHPDGHIWGWLLPQETR